MRRAVCAAIPRAAITEWRNGDRGARPQTLTVGGRGIFRRIQPAEEELMGSMSKARRRSCGASLIAMLAAAAASAQPAPGSQSEKPQAETAPARPAGTPLPA